MNRIYPTPAATCPVCARAFMIGDKSRSFACSVTCGEEYRRINNIPQHQVVKR